MISLLLSALLQTAAPSAAPAPAQDPVSLETPTRLEDIEVTGRPLEQMIRTFVREVAAPNRGRSLARWEDGICVGVANLRPEAGQFIADRVSTVAQDLGLRPGRPGCRPNILVVATDQAPELAAAMVRERQRAFIPGGSGMDQGRTALAAFQSNDRPVRWWAVSAPVDSETGRIAVRLPGRSAPEIRLNAMSTLSTQVVDSMNRVFVIVDVDKVSSLTPIQLADYIAMVSLAQIDPEADTSAYASILNVFDDPSTADSLTDWDQAYLKGLYSVMRTQKIPGAARLEVSNSIRRAHRELRSQREAQTDD